MKTTIICRCINLIIFCSMLAILCNCASKQYATGYEVPDHTYHAMEGNGNSGVYHPY
jgi:hypothetical protein